MVAGRLAAALHELAGGYVEVMLLSATGTPPISPWRVVIRLTEDIGPGPVQQLVEQHLHALPTVTQELVEGRVLLS